MADQPRRILICSCEDTMPLDAEAVRRGCRSSQVTTARQLCRSELDRFREAAASRDPVIVACTQEAPLFAEIAAGGEGRPDIRYVNIRQPPGVPAAPTTASAN